MGVSGSGMSFIITFPSRERYQSGMTLRRCLHFAESFARKSSTAFIPLVKKAYGGIAYSRTLSDIPGYDYVVVPFEEGMKRTVE